MLWDLVKIFKVGALPTAGLAGTPWLQMRRVVILGAGGQLGTELVTALRGFQLVPLVHKDLDVNDPERVRCRLGDLRPQVVINASAFVKVDACEELVREAFAVNAVAPYHLARLSVEFDFTLVHFSTDYVFDGRARRPYREDATPNPLNVYGASKLAGEQLIRLCRGRFFIVRTAGLYGRAGARAKGGNFVETILRLAESGTPVRVVDDQITTPTSTSDLAAAVAALIEHEAESSVSYGTYHVTNAGQCSWYEFAREICALARLSVAVQPISSAEFNAKAARPAYSVLDNSRWGEAGFEKLRPWQDALADYLRVRRSGARW